MDQPKEKRYPTIAGVHMVNQTSFISSQAYMISLSLLLLLTQGATGQE